MRRTWGDDDHPPPIQNVGHRCRMFPGTALTPRRCGPSDRGAIDPAKVFCVAASVFATSRAVTQPLAIVFYETLLPGRQLANKLTDLGYRVQTATVAAGVADLVRKERPMVLIAQLGLRHGDFCGVIAELKKDPAVAHVPVIGYTSTKDKKLQDAAVKAGAKLVAADSAILDQLPHLLEHALAVE